MICFGVVQALHKKGVFSIKFVYPCCKVYFLLKLLCGRKISITYEEISDIWPVQLCKFLQTMLVRLPRLQFCSTIFKKVENCCNKKLFTRV